MTKINETSMLIHIFIQQFNTFATLFLQFFNSSKKYSIKLKVIDIFDGPITLQHSLH